MRRTASLRLTVVVAVAITLASLGAMLLQYFEVSRAFDRQQIAALQSDLDGYSALYEQRRIIALRQAMQYRATAQPSMDQVYLLLNKNGAVLGGNLTAWPYGVLPRGETFVAEDTLEFEHHGSRFVGVARTLPGGFDILVARSMVQKDTLLSDMRQMIFLMGIGLILLGLFAGWIVSRYVLRRIDRVNALADKVASGDIDARISGTRSPDEFGALEQHVHDMLDRIVVLQNATHRLSDAIAHELRTPLNRILQKLAEIENQGDLVHDIREEMRTTVKVFDSLLDIAGAEAASGSTPGLRAVNLSTICAQVYDLYEPVAEDRELEFKLSVVPELWILGDPNLITQLLSNLVDNALKFTSAGDQTEIILEQADHHHRMCVRDNGPGVPDDVKGHLFDRFSRSERDHNVAGHGLGLALVQAIATRHGAKLTVLSEKRGFAVEVLWPTVRPAT